MDIPGYQIIDELGRGGMARVYLAMQESLERHVALKIMSEALAADPTFTERFLKEGRIVARLSHPNIVTVYDFGSYKGSYYMAMEYLPGGTLEEQIEKGIALDRVLEIIGTVASALGYAHKQGFIHRDVKPLNILFRKDGTPVLSDFGIARVVHGYTELTAAGQVVGSPGYMSPERIRGQQIDARSDLYSLGIVFFKMLTGRMPYPADDPVAVAMMHTTAPIPVLPKQFVRFQVLLEKLLAKEADQRFQTAEEFIVALSKAQAGQVDEADKTEIAPDVVRQKKPEESPALEKNVKTSPRTKLGLSFGLGTISVLSAAGGIYWVLNAQSPAPPSEPAVDATKPFLSTPDIGEKPQEPMDGMKAVAAYYHQQAKRYQQEENFEESLDQIEQGLRILPDDPELLGLRREVQTELAEQQRRRAEAERREREIERLLVQAERQREQDRLTQPADDNAYASYRQVLALDPDNAQARQGIEAIAARYRESAERLQGQGSLEESLAAIEQGLALQPDDSDLLALREQVQIQLVEQQRRRAEAERREREIERLLVQAERQREQDRLTQPADDNAYASYRQVLALDPGNAQARQGIEELAARYSQLAERLQGQGSLEESLAAIAQGLAVRPDDSDLLALREQVQIQLAEQQRRRAEAERREREIERLLVQAERQREQDRLTQPADDNAYASYRQVLALDPDNAQARQGIEELAARYSQLAERLQGQGSLELSRAAIEQGLRILPDDPELLGLRREVQTQLAEQQRRRAEAERREREIERLLAQAKRLRAQGSLEESLAAIEQGLAVRPDDSGLLALRRKVQAQIREKKELAEKQPQEEGVTREVEQLLAQAEEQLQRWRLTVPAGDNAYDTYQSILNLDPDNEKARQGFIDIADRYRQLAERVMQRGDFNRSLEFIERGLQVVPQHSELLAVRQNVIQAQQAEAQRSRAQEEARRAEAERRKAEEDRRRAEEDRRIATRQEQQERREREVRDLLTQGERQLQRSQLTAAYNSFQQVLRLDPQNQGARRGLTEIGDRYLQLAQQSKNRGALQESLTNIAAGLRVVPQHRGLLALRNEIQIMLLRAQEKPQAQEPEKEEPEKTKMVPFATF